MELDRRNAEEAVLWDELSMDALWEAVIGEKEINGLKKKMHLEKERER